MSTALVSYQPQNLAQLEDFSKRLAQSGIVPQQYRGKPNDVFVACMWGWETAELTPMTSLAYIDVIQGKAAYKSEGLVAIALRKGYITDVDEEFTGEGDDYAAVCTVTKKNGRTLTRKFSIADAKAAGLYGKDNWKKWLDRMLIARARGFAVRDAAPHAMLSYSAEEVRDFDGNAHHGPEHAKDVTPAPAAQPMPQSISGPELVALYDQWGAEYLLQPGEVAQWVKDAVSDATEDELQALIENNAENARVVDAVKAEVNARMNAEPPSATTAAETAVDWKARGKAITDAFKRAQTMDALNQLEALHRDEIGAFPTAAKSRVAAVFHEMRGKLMQPEPAPPATSFHDEFAQMEDPLWREGAEAKQRGWAQEEGRVDDPRQPELIA